MTTTCKENEYQEMTTTCKVINPKTKEFFADNEEALIPVTKKSKIREINFRGVAGRADEQLTIADYAAERPNKLQVQDSDITLRISSNTSAAAMCHRYSSEKAPTFEINRDSRQVTVKTNNQWEQENDQQKDKKRWKMAERLGELTERAITHEGSGKMMLHHYTRQSGNCVRISVRETDAVNRNVHNELEAVEIKGVGLLSMSKVRFFNSRLYPMVAKAVASGCPATYIVARDDREMVVNIDGPIDRDIFPVMEVQYWQDVRRLLKSTEIENFTTYNARFSRGIEIISEGEVREILNSEEGISIGGNPKKLTCPANVPRSGMTTAKGGLKTNIIVGPGIPYFEFRLSEFYMTYKHKHQKHWKMQKSLLNVVVLVRNSEELKDVFQNYEPHHNQKPLHLTIYSEEPIDRNCLQDKFGSKNSFDYIVYTDKYHLGTMLYNKNMTFCAKPIPKVLLLLGDKQHVPLCLITARLSFGLLNKVNGKYATGIDMKEIPKPDIVGIIGTEDEWLTTDHLPLPDAPVYKFKRGQAPLNYTPAGPNYLCKSEDILVGCMKEAGFPMYKTFDFVNDEYAAT